MKKNNLTTAVVAGIAGIAGISSISQAVNLNSDGLGQVLVFPYYTVNNGLNTLISVVNTTNEVKAVKVRFLEGKNSRECLDFNLYLSPYDVWTSALVPTTSTAGFVTSEYAGQNSVKLLTSDTSCTAPEINGYEFLPWGFDPQGDGSTANGYDTGGRDLQRCTEGHFEMIEMGTVVDTANNGLAATSATHGFPGTANAGVPNDCGTITGNWTPGTGYWSSIDPTDGIVDPDGTGGLFGSTSLIDVEKGVDVAYNADAIQSYSTSAQHTDTGNLIPNLASGSSQVSYVFNEGAVESAVWNLSSIQAVSALYMHDNLYGEYVLSDSIGANTEWVVTFPTKNAYVDSFLVYNAFGVAPYEPFTEAFTAGTSCEPYLFTGLYDREEQVGIGDPEDLIPSPPPPNQIITTPVFCYEANVLEFHDGAVVDGPSAILGSLNATHVSTAATPTTYFDTGWASLTFTGISVGGVAVDHWTNDNVGGTLYEGLPVTGFAVQRYVNNGDASGARNYAGLFRHRYTKAISS